MIAGERGLNHQEHPEHQEKREIKNIGESTNTNRVLSIPVLLFLLGVSWCSWWFDTKE
jgi:hypothetical protein